MNSTHRVEVIALPEPQKHPDADSLSTVEIDGYVVVINTAQWEGKTKAAYVPPDNLVPLARPEFSFLVDPKRPDKEFHHVKAKRLRGIWSMGLLIPMPDDAEVGQDIAGELGVVHYEPPEPTVGTGGNAESGPKRIKRSLEAEDVPEIACQYPKYDVDALRKYGRKLFTEGEPVFVTEKIHGSNIRMLWDGERFYVGSKREWKAYDADNTFWRALHSHEEIQSFLKANPGVCIYGEVYGAIQKGFNYGLQPGTVRVACFDIYLGHQNRWLDAHNYGGDLCYFNKALHFAGPAVYSLPWVPIVEKYMPYNFDKLLEMAESKSRMPGASHIAEGLVVKPLIERYDARLGRANLKLVSNAYLGKS